MAKRQILLLAISLLLALTTHGQDLKVRSMSMNAGDLSASTQRRLDINKKPCALVKVQLPLSGAVFEGNVIQPVEYKTNEYWVYMTEGSKELHIKHPNYQTLVVNFPDYGIRNVESLGTYKLVITMPEQAKEVKKQKLIINYQPENAMVLIDSDPYPGSGHIETELPLGEHTYTIAANGYITAEGMVKLNGGSQRVITEQLEKKITSAGTQQTAEVAYISGMDTDATNANNEEEKKILTINVTPLKSNVYIDGKLQKNENGVITLNLPYGKYKYKVEYQGYVTQQGTLKHTKEKMQHTIKLVTNAEFQKHRMELVKILETYRIALEEKELTSLEKTFSDSALIITGNVVQRRNQESDQARLKPEIRYSKLNKGQYMQRLTKTFKNNKFIKVKFNDISIVKHPANDNLYGVTLRQEWNSDSYHGEGYMFLLWQFPPKEGGQPWLHIRTWQPEKDNQGHVILDDSEKFTCDYFADFTIR